MPIASISLSNTFAQWLVTTQNIVTEINKLETSTYTKTANTFFITSSGVGLYVSDSATIGTLSILNNLTVSKNLLVSGNSSTISGINFSNNDIVISSTGVSTGNSRIIINRGESSNPANANAHLVWAESEKLWKVRDVNSPNSYYSIVTSNNVSTTSVAGIVQLSDVVTSTSSSLAATANTVKIAFDKATNAYDQANTGTSLADAAYDQANAGIVFTTTVYDQANTGISIGSNAFGRANAAYDQANTGTSIAISAYNQANTVSSVGVTAAYDQANAAYNQANSGISIAGNAFSRANAAYTQANAGITLANSAYTQANNGISIAGNAFGRANAAYNQANSGITLANSAYTQANNGISIAGNAFGRANAAYDQANTGTSIAISAYNQANTANSIARGAYTQANTATSIATSAFDKANTGGLTITNVSTSGFQYVMFSGATTGSIATANVTTSKLSFNPGTGVLQATQFTGNASSLLTTSAYQIASLGVGTAASGTTGEIRATNNITAYYSDKRLKENIEQIPNPIDKIRSLNGVYFNNNELAESYGYSNKEKQVGVIAQEVESVLPEAIKLAPFDSDFDEDGNEYSISGENYLTVQYEKLIPLLIECIKKLENDVEELRKLIK